MRGRLRDCCWAKIQRGVEGLVLIIDVLIRIEVVAVVREVRAVG